MVQTAFDIASSQHLADDLEYPLVVDAHMPEFSEQQSVVDVVKTSLNVSFYCPYRLILRPACGVDDVDNISNSVLLCPVGPEPIAVRVKPCFANGL